MLLAALLLTLAAAPAPLDQALAPPPNWQWGEFRNAQGAKLRYGSAVPSGAQAHIAVVGGYTEFAEKYFEVIRELHAAGYGVWFLDWRGQGGSDRYHAERQRAILVNLDDDARDAREFISAKIASTKVCVIGHSLGAHILVRYLHNYPQAARCAVLSSPTLAFGNVSWMPQWLIQAKVSWAKWKGQAQDYATDQHEWKEQPDMEAQMSSDLRRRVVHRQWYLKDPSLRLGGVTYQWVDTFLRSSVEVLQPDYLKQIRTPILMGSASGDILASVEAQREAARHLPSAQRIEYAPALHELFMEADRVRAPWMQAILRFLARHLK